MLFKIHLIRNLHPVSTRMNPDNSQTTAYAGLAGAVSGAITGAVYHLLQPAPPLSQEDWGIVTTVIDGAQQAAIALLVFVGLAYAVLRSRPTNQVVGYLSAFWMGTFILGGVVSWALNRTGQPASSGPFMEFSSAPVNWAVVGTVLSAFVVSRRPR